MSSKPDRTEPITVAAVDAAGLQAEALAALAGASTLAELTELRTRYLGRKSELKQALREVRDRESGMTLNAVRERLEAAIDQKREALERDRLDRALAEQVVDVTLPGETFERGHYHLITQIRREVEDI